MQQPGASRSRLEPSSAVCRRSGPPYEEESHWT